MHEDKSLSCVKTDGADCQEKSRQVPSEVHSFSMRTSKVAVLITMT